MREFLAELAALELMTLGVILVTLGFTLPQFCLITGLCPLPHPWAPMLPLGVGTGLGVAGFLSHPIVARTL